jgi:hypothetical protein
VSAEARSLSIAVPGPFIAPAGFHKSGLSEGKRGSLSSRGLTRSSYIVIVSPPSESSCGGVASVCVPVPWPSCGSPEGVKRSQPCVEVVVPIAGTKAHHFNLKVTKTLRWSC